jgi:hypothetical protein
LKGPLKCRRKPNTWLFNLRSSLIKAENNKLNSLQEQIHFIGGVLFKGPAIFLIAQYIQNRDPNFVLIP